MKTTGNAGGSHNLEMTSRLTRPGDDLAEMLRKLGTGLFVIELMGQGVNYVTGDYSRGASGFWVENGELAYPVQEITIAGNMKSMFAGIQAVGSDTYNYGAKTVGSILIDRMKVAAKARAIRPTGRRPRSHASRPPEAAFTAAETWLMSALPAKRAFAAPMTLPISPGPLAPSSATIAFTCAGNLFGRQTRGQIGLQHDDLGCFLVGQILARGLLERLHAVLALLDQLVDDPDHGRVVQLDALVHFLLLHGGHQQADRAEALGVLGAHGGLHVFGDAFFKAHQVSPGIGNDKARLSVPRRAWMLMQLVASARAREATVR